MTAEKLGNRWPSMVRAKAIGRALVVGSRQAGKELGIPQRTVASWANGERVFSKAEVATLRSEALEKISDTMIEALAESVASVRDGLASPRSRLSDRAQALETLVTAYQLLSGGATARTDSRVLTGALDAPPVEPLSFEEQTELRQWLEELKATDG